MLDERVIDCGYQGCFDRTLHTFARFKECILDKGGTKSEAKRLWNAQMEKNQVALQGADPRPAPVYRPFIECHYDGCGNSGHHTLDQLIGCIAAAGRPFLDAVRCWNYNVPEKYKVPVSAFQPPAASDAPHAVAAASPEPPVTPISDPAGANPDAMLPVLYREPVDIGRLARIYSNVLDVGGLMSFNHGHFNEAVNQNPHVGKINCRNVDCHKQSLHTFADFLECSIAAGDFLDEAAARWSMSEPSEEQTPFCFSVIPETPYQKYRKSQEYLDTLKPKEREPFDWNTTSPEFRDAFILRHGRDGRVLLSAQQARVENVPVQFSYDNDRVESYSNAGKMKYVAVIREGRFKGSSYENGMIMVGGSHRYGYCMHMVPDGCLHEDDTRVSTNRRINCSRVLCAECLLPTCNKTAARALARLSAMMLRLRAGLYKPPRKWIFIHGVYSLSEDHCGEFMTRKGRKRVYARFIREVKRLGFVGGLYVPHPWRFDKKLEGKKWSVHIHFIAAGYVDHDAYRVKNAKAIMAGKMSADPITDLNRRTGDEYIHIRNFSDFGGAFDATSYMLSHAGVEATGGQVLKYFGEAAPNKFGTKNVFSNQADIREELEEYTRALYEVKFGKKVGRFVDGKVVTYFVKSDYMDVDLKRLGKPLVQKLQKGDLEYLLNSLHGTSKQRSLPADNPANAGSTGVENGDTEEPPYKCDCGNPKCEVPLPKQVCDCKTGICDCLEDGSVPFVHAVPKHTVNVFAVIGLRYQLYEKLAIGADGKAVPVDDPTGPGPPKAIEYAKKELVLHFDPSMIRLCPKCRKRKQVILPKNGILPQPYDPERHNNHRCYNDGDNWEVLDPMKHLYKGRPHCKPLDDMVGWDVGLGLPNRHYDGQPRELRDIQDLSILKTFITYISKVACEILHDREENCSIKAIRPYVRKHLYETGLPEIKDKYWDYTLADLVVGLWRKGGLNTSQSAD